MTPRLLLPAPALAEIEAEVKAAWPEEGCGLLIGTCAGESVWVTSVAASPNLAPPETRARRFEVDPALLLRLHRELRGTGREIVGLYHSHPNGRAELSAADRAEAWTPGLAWLVLALVAGEVTARAAFLHCDQDGPAVFEPMAIEAASPDPHLP